MTAFLFSCQRNSVRGRGDRCVGQRSEAPLRLLADVAIGATMELGRSWRTLLMS